jgi:integrase
MIRDPAYYGLEKESFSRILVSVRDKSWSASNVNIQEILDKVEPIDRLVAVQLRLMHEFGLRLREAILIRPLLSHVDNTIRVEEGTKGGRSRVVSIRYESQIKAIDIAKAASRHCRKGSLVPQGHDFDSTRSRFYYVMRLCGITKAQLGVTSHGLRHEYANDLYEDLSGQPSVVRGASQILDRAKDRAARQAVTSDLGHVRLDVTAAYTGPLRPRRSASPPTPQAQPPAP